MTSRIFQARSFRATLALGFSVALLALTGTAIVLAGTGVPSAPTVALSATKLHFKTMLLSATSAPLSLTLSNDGTSLLKIDSIITSGDFSQTNTCDSELASGEDCSINVTFSPTQIGTRKGTLSITDNATDSPQMVTLEGTSTAVKFTPAALKFGKVNVGDKRTIAAVLTNTGTTVLHISGIVITGEDPSEFSQTNNCSTSIGAGQTCTISVTFAPRFGLRPGLVSAALAVSDNGGTSPQRVGLSGNGILK